MNHKDPDLDTYCRYVTEHSHSLPHHEELKLAERITLGDQEATDLLVESCLKLALDYATSFYKYEQQQHHTVTLRDCIHAANTGLFRAAEKYASGDGKRFPFRQYAHGGLGIH